MSDHATYGEHRAFLKQARLDARASGYDAWTAKETTRARRGKFVIDGTCYCGGLDCRQPRCRGEVCELALDVQAFLGPLSADYHVECE